MSHVRALFLGGDVREDFGRLATTEVERGDCTGAGALVFVLHRPPDILGLVILDGGYPDLDVGRRQFQPNGGHRRCCQGLPR
eukprot:637462-Amphidinium_carterae.1